MKSDEIEKLFSSLLENPAQDNHDVRKVFSILLHRTLEYRDNLLESKGIILTVEDVRRTLDWLVPTLTAGKMPDSDNDIRLDLLKVWTRELAQSSLFHPSEENH